MQNHANSYAPPPGPPPGQDTALPPGWISQFDAGSGKTFFVNTATGQSQWHHPVQQYTPPGTGYQPPYQQPYQPQQPQQTQPSSQSKPDPIKGAMNSITGLFGKKPQPSNSSYPGGSSGYPGPQSQSQGYPGSQSQGYPGQAQGYPGSQAQGYPGQAQGYPGPQASQGYPGPQASPQGYPSYPNYSAPQNPPTQQYYPQQGPPPAQPYQSPAVAPPNGAATGQQTTADAPKPLFTTAPTVSTYGTEISHASAVPEMGRVETVDATVAIALELKQSVPTLRDGPPANSKQPIKDAYRRYLREIQDAQNTHTRCIRDAQVQHQKDVRDADYYSKHQTQNAVGSMGYYGGGSLLSNATSLFNKATNFTQGRDHYNQLLQDAKLNYDRSVEHSSQRLNDAVEYANRHYDDVIYELSKQDL
ncbi:hypothetical protein HDU91_006892 [Kappamyces sp. JEL0680]|nr:hypothetical protein HDU91_006892 [Kappamyces sp. JEL0680]